LSRICSLQVVFTSCLFTGRSLQTPTLVILGVFSFPFPWVKIEVDLQLFIKFASPKDLINLTHERSPNFLGIGISYVQEACSLILGMYFEKLGSSCEPCIIAMIRCRNLTYTSANTRAVEYNVFYVAQVSKMQVLGFGFWNVV